MATFNLVERPWIPVLDEDGRPTRVGLQEALLESDRWQCLYGLSPLAEAAVLRLLLAVAHRALRGPRRFDEALEWFRQGRFPEGPILDYLEKWRHRFDLFHPERPFYQVPDMPGNDPIPWTKLFPEIASGNNPTLFDHTLDDAPPDLSPEHAVVALLVHQTFTTGGLIRRYGVVSGKGGPLATAAVFIPQGRNLFETAVFNMPPYDPEYDEPIWEQEPYQQAQKPLRGRTRRYAWLTRSIKLLPEDDSGRVRWIDYGPGVTSAEEAERDPMCAYRRDRENGLQIVRLRMDRAFWRDFEAILPDDQSRSRVIVIEHATQLLQEASQTALVFPLAVIGQVTHKAKVLDVRRETYPLSPQILEPDRAARIRGAVRQAERADDWLRRATRTVAQVLLAPSDRQPDPKQVEALRKSFPTASTYWSALYTDFPRFLEALAYPGDLTTAARLWIDAVRRAVRTAWQATAETVGRLSARNLKALVKGERIVRRGLREVTHDRPGS